MTFHKLVKLTAGVDCELEPVLIVLEDGKHIHKKIVQLSSNEMRQVNESIRLDCGLRDCTVTPDDNLKSLPGLFGMVHDILIVSDYLRREIESGIINLQKISIEQKRREDALKTLPGFGGNWKVQ